MRMPPRLNCGEGCQRREHRSASLGHWRRHAGKRRLQQHGKPRRWRARQTWGPRGPDPWTTRALRMRRHCLHRRLLAWLPTAVANLRGAVKSGGNSGPPDGAVCGAEGDTAALIAFLAAFGQGMSRWPRQRLRQRLLTNRVRSGCSDSCVQWIGARSNGCLLHRARPAAAPSLAGCPSTIEDVRIADLVRRWRQFPLEIPLPLAH